MPDGFSNNNPQKSQKNVLGGVLQTCSMDPVTGFYRNGCCETDYTDYGLHTVCSEMTFEFLEHSKSVGNDLSTPRPEFEFQGLKPGDKVESGKNIEIKVFYIYYNLLKLYLWFL